MRKTNRGKPKLKTRSANLFIVFSILVVLPASFFVAGDIFDLALQPQNSANDAQVAIAPKTSYSPLFDVKVTVLPEYKSAVAGSKVLATIAMKNLGTPGNPIDIELSTSIADANGAVVYSYSKDTLAVATQLTVVRELLVPADFKSGTYSFFVSVKYDSQIAESYDSFTVTAPRVGLMINKTIPYTLLAVLAAIIIASAIILTKQYSIVHR